MVLIFTIAEGDQETCIGDGLHLREKPFRVDKSAGPVTAPASRRKAWLSDFLALSNCSRIIRPFGTPVLRAVSASHSANSAGTRTVSVLLICI